MTHPNELTDARTAIWDAIEAETAINSQIKGKFKFETTNSEGPGPTEPSITQCPAIAIQPMLLSPKLQFQQRRLNYRVLVRVWTPHWDLPAAEKMVCRLYKTIATDATVKNMKPEFNIGMAMTKLGGGSEGPRVIRADIQINLTTCLE